MEPSIVASPQPAMALQVKGMGFGIRAGSYIIDVIAIWLMTLAVAFITGILFGLALYASGRDANLGESSWGLNLLVGFVTSTIFSTLFEWLYGATPGKLILGMRVIMEDGAPCTFGAALLRALLRFIDGLFFGIPAYASMKEPLLQRIGDKAAKTIVVSSKDPFIRQGREWWWFALALGANLVVTAVATVIQLISMMQ